MFSLNKKPEPAPVWETNPEAITDKFREQLQKTAMRNDNEIAELQTIIADAQARLAHRQSVSRSLQAALIELGMTDALNTMAQDLAELPITVTKRDGELCGTHEMAYANAV